MKTSLLNKGELINAIDARINSGEYKNFPSTKNRLREIMVELLKGVIEISDNSYWTLIMEGFIHA